jgi:hypothetical protein
MGGGNGPAQRFGVLGGISEGCAGHDQRERFTTVAGNKIIVPVEKGAMRSSETIRVRNSFT